MHVENGNLKFKTEIFPNMDTVNGKQQNNNNNLKDPLREMKHGNVSHTPHVYCCSVCVPVHFYTILKLHENKYSIFADNDFYGTTNYEQV